MIYQWGDKPLFIISNVNVMLAQMLVISYMFMRNDRKENMPRGVCYDFCCFLNMMQIIKQKNVENYLLSELDKGGEINWTYIDGKTILKIDPYNGKYENIDNTLSNIGAIEDIRIITPQTILLNKKEMDLKNFYRKR